MAANAGIQILPWPIIRHNIRKSLNPGANSPSWSNLDSSAHPTFLIPTTSSLSQPDALLAPPKQIIAHWATFVACYQNGLDLSHPCDNKAFVNPDDVVPGVSKLSRDLENRFTGKVKKYRKSLQSISRYAD
jgi:hypothetical protein